MSLATKKMVKRYDKQKKKCGDTRADNAEEIDLFSRDREFLLNDMRNLSDNLS
jgi:hypothetical protein